MNIDALSAPPPHPLSKPINDLIYQKYRTTPRHLQRELGPSEIGEPCDRKLALKAMHEPEFNTGDPLPSIVGTAAHTWMESACKEWNEHVGRMEWIPELELKIVQGIPGHCDAYHVPTQTVVDWKFPGTASMKRYREHGPSDIYRVQAHLYGKGWHDIGLPVREVAIVFFPRGGNLHGKYGRVIWSEPWDPTVGELALDRYYGIVDQAVKLDVEHHPERYKAFPTVREHHCTYCPWFSPSSEDKGNMCPGWTEGK